MNDHINLLPLRFRRKLLVRLRLFQWGLVLLVTLTIMLGASFWNASQLESRRHALAIQEQRVVPIRKMLSENEEMKQQLFALTERHKLLNKLESTQQPLRIIGLVSRSARITGKRLQVQNFSLEHEEHPTVSTPGKEGKQDVPSENHLTLKGIAIDDLAVTQFVHALRNGTPFNNVELKSSVANKELSVDLREYLIECSF